MKNFQVFGSSDNLPCPIEEHLQGPVEARNANILSMQ